MGVGGGGVVYTQIRGGLQDAGEPTWTLFSSNFC